MVIKPLVGTGKCNNTILCSNCVFWETVSICAAVHLCNWNYFILNHIIPSTDRVHSSCGSDRDPPPLGSLQLVPVTRIDKKIRNDRGSTDTRGIGNVSDVGRRQ